MTLPSQDRRDVRHGILTTGRDKQGRPVREYRELTRGTPALLAFQDYEHIPRRQLDLIVNDLIAEQQRRDGGK